MYVSIILKFIQISFVFLMCYPKGINFEFYKLGVQTLEKSNVYICLQQAFSLFPGSTILTIVLINKKSKL